MKRSRHKTHPFITGATVMGLMLLMHAALYANAQTMNNAGALSADTHSAYYQLTHLNQGLPPAPEAINLQTPQAALEFFVLRSRERVFAEAARVLNLNLVPAQSQASVAAELAEQLFFVLDSQRLIQWDDVSDRPDAQVQVVPGSSNPLAGEPLRSVLIGSLRIDERDIAIRLQRVRVANEAPVWVFSANTVENIPALYELYGPAPMDTWLPAWLTARPVFGVTLWEWGALLLLIAFCALLGWLAGRLSESIAKNAGGMVATLAMKLVRPVAFAVAFGLLFTLTSGGWFFSGSVLSVLQPVLWVLFIAVLTWAGTRVISLFTRRFERQSENIVKEGYNEHAQQQLTALSVARRIFIFVVILLGFGVGLSQFTSLELLSTTLLTSAGIASVIIGIAAQPVLSNIVAGVQVAITQPVRIGDSVFIEGNWGYVEDLRYTYALVRTWDERRLVLPLRYLVSEPYENWTLKDTHIIKPIYVYTDYRVDVQKIRDKFTALLKASDAWDERQTPMVQVTAVMKDAVEVRALCSAKDPSAAWTLHCELREALLAYVQQLEDGAYLPRQRVQLQEHPFHAASERPHES